MNVEDRTMGIDVQNTLHENVHTFKPFSYRVHEMVERSISTPEPRTSPGWDIQLMINEQLLANWFFGLTAAEHISELKKLYTFSDGLVDNFLEENPSLTELLLEAHKVIREHFGSGVETTLEVVTDPEALGDQQLFVLIRTDLPRKEARRHLAELDQGWWLSVLPAADGKVEIALE